MNIEEVLSTTHRISPVRGSPFTAPAAASAAAMSGKAFPWKVRMYSG